MRRISGEVMGEGEESGKTRPGERTCGDVEERERAAVTAAC